MSLSLEQLSAAVLELPSTERAKLAHLLIRSLDDEDEDPAEVEHLRAVRLAEACSYLDPVEERALAEEEFGGDPGRFAYREPEDAQAE